MIAKARELMKHQASDNPISFNLLPELFTLTQLQNLYEAIYGEQMDKRNFRKKVCEMPYFIKTGRIDKSSSKRGAAIYVFDYNMYQEHRDFHL